MRFSIKYAPQNLDQIVGQPAVVRRLKTFCLEPYSACWLFHGPGGTGKSATAQALIHDLHASLFNCAEYSGAKLLIDNVERMFTQTFRTHPMYSDWHILLIEELEYVASAAVNSALKRHLSEQNLPSRLIVIATSNNLDSLDPALIQRFDVLRFSSGQGFASSAADLLRSIWLEETGGNVPFPNGLDSMGWTGKQYSLRVAINALQAAISAKVQVA